MKLCSILLCLAFVVALPSPALAQEKLELSLAAAPMSKYVWRGAVLTDGAVFQPGATVAYKGFSFNLWKNMDLSDTNGKSGKFTEIDYTFNYSFSLDRYGLSLGTIIYTFPNTGFDPTTELYFGLSAESVLNPSVTVYLDLDESEGIYLNFAIGHSFGLCDKAALDLSTGLGLGSADNNLFYYGADSAAFTDLLLGVSLPLALGEHISLTPSLAFTALLGGDIRDLAWETRGSG